MDDLDNAEVFMSENQLTIILSYGFFVFFILGSVSMGLGSRILFWAITQGLKIEKVVMYLYVLNRRHICLKNS